MSLIFEAARQELDYVPELSIVEFAESLEHCGLRLYDRQRVLLKLIWLEEMEGWEEDVLQEWIDGKHGVEISPYIRERRDQLREKGYPHFSEVVLTLGRRASKGFVTGISGARKIDMVRQLADPGAHYHLPQSKEIYFTAVAAALHQAKGLQFADLSNTVTGCASMRPFIHSVNEESFHIAHPKDDEYAAKLKEAGVSVSRNYSKLRAKPVAANAGTLRGMTSMFSCLDEMAHMQPGESKSTADACYTAMEPSLQQFGKDSLLFLNSSPWSKIGKFFDRYQDAMQTEAGKPSFPTIMAFRAPSWELYRDAKGAPKRSYVPPKMVDPDLDPSELKTDDEREMQLKLRLSEKGNPESFAVEYRAQWAEVQDSYFNSTAVDRAFTGYMTLKNEDGEIENVPVVPQEGGTYVHVFQAHVDPSSTTAGFGFVLGHMEQYPDPEFGGQLVGHVIADVVKRWDPADFPGHTIRYEEVIKELVHYCKLYRPASISHDQHMGTLFGQNLRAALRKAKLNETRVYESTGQEKKNWDQWELLKTAFNLNWVHIHPDLEDAEFLKQELKYLKEVRPGKVDKQTTGPVQTKDIADALRETTFALIGNQMRDLLAGDFKSTKIRTTAQGGYAVGKSDQNPLGGSKGPGDFYSSRGHGPQGSHRGISRG